MASYISVNCKDGSILQNKNQHSNLSEEKHITQRDPRVQDLFNPVHFLSLGLGSGLLRPAPGTWGSLAALPVWLLLTHLSVLLYITVILFMFLLGIYFCGYTTKKMGMHDHSAIVWDEFVGMWLALFLVPMSWLGVLLAFVFFRLFDIWKPWPIRYFDKQVHGGLGIMIDDLIAGVFACVCTHLALNFLGGF